MNFAFYISKTSGRLFKFLTLTKKTNINDIKLVVSEYQVEERLKDCLSNLGIDVVVIDYYKLHGSTNREKNLELSNAMLKLFHKYKINYCISFGSHILCGKLLDEYKYRLINFHPAILPMFPGNCAIDQAVKHGNIFLVGNTAHFIDEGIDTGVVIMQSVIPLQSFLDSEQNYDIVLDLVVQMLEQLFYVLKNNLLVIDNGRALIKGADYLRSNIYPLIDIKNNGF